SPCASLLVTRALASYTVLSPVSCLYLPVPLAVVPLFFFQAEDGIRDRNVTGVQTCALPISCSRCPRGTPWSSSCAMTTRPTCTTWCWPTAPRPAGCDPVSPPPSSPV